MRQEYETGNVAIQSNLKKKKKSLKDEHKNGAVAEETHEIKRGTF